MGPTESVATVRPAVAIAASEAPAYDNSAAVFLNSNNIATYIRCAKEVIKTVLDWPESKWPQFNLPHNLTLLHMACLASDEAFLTRLLTIPEFTGQLYQSCNSIAIDQLALLDSVSGAPLMPAINSDPPLHFALFTGFTEGIKIIIATMKEHGRLVCPANATGNNLFNLAAGCSSVECMQLLCDHFNDQTLVNHISHRGSTPLHHAARTGRPEVFLLLLQHGAAPSLSIRDLGNRTPIEHIGSDNPDACAREEQPQYDAKNNSTRVSRLFARIDQINENLLNIDMSSSACSSLHNEKEAVMSEISRWEEIVSHASAIALAQEVKDLNPQTWLPG